MKFMQNPLDLLRLMQLADSALPIGGAAHSFGLETMVAEGALKVDDLEEFLESYLAETGLVDAVFCRAARAHDPSLDQMLSAMRPAREARGASLALGRRFLQFVNTIAPLPSLPSDGLHFVTAFGYACGILGFEPEPMVLAYLQQSIVMLVSACQRLMPLGQSRAGRILWDLKPSIIATERRSWGFTVNTVGSFTALPDLAAMRHPSLEPRLFIS